MGRSKFPGKPSKHVNRTRINVLPPLSNSATVGEIKLVLNSENEAETQQNENSSESKTENEEPSTSQQVSSESQKNKLSRKKRKCITNRASSVTKAGRICRDNMNIKRNKVAVNNLSELPHTKRAGVRRPVQNFSTLRRLNRANSMKENNNLVGKFVLPSRSVHSSRVIKPNKRFINVESVNRIEVRTMKKRVVNRRNVKPSDEGKGKSKLCDQNNQGSSENTNSSTMQCANRRIILRQARLQLNNSTPSGTEGPFSSQSSSGSPPGTITCGVCGAVRFYRFVKQARKFNIYSCESCRKFISKIIKRQTCNKNSSLSTLVCHKGQGKCHVPPIVRSQQWNLIHCAYRARCPACWLKMCLRSFQMPQNLKNNLYKLLPVNMRRPENNLFNNSVSLFSWQNSNTNDTVPTLSPSLSSGTSENLVKQRPTRLKQPKPEEKTNNVVPSSDIRRQKIDLKGPRVKHVCRSASIVLGQPIATFQSEPDKNETESSDSQNKTPDYSDAQTSSSEKIDSSVSKDTCAEKATISENKMETETVVSKNGSNKTENISTNKKEKGKTSGQNVNNLESKAPPLNKKSSLEVPKNGICIDYWESYDPDEICQSGFSLIASEEFPMQAICFLCGSAGREPLLYCSLCCEPYHSFCLEQDPQLLGSSVQYHNWLCPRCTTCNSCGQADRQKVNCQKCHKTYHPECFNCKWIMDDKPTVCSSCLRCKSCGTNNITKFIGNLPLCVMCFKLRKKGNFCPLCQKCYDDNDFDTKMMECAKCNKWVHAKCEGLSDESYQILSLLPESIEFVCKTCSNNTTPYWRKAVESELKANFNNVLRLLSKNRIARDMLKWSLLCNNNTNTKNLSTARKLQFSDEDSSDKTDRNISSSESNSLVDEENFNKTVQKKITLKDYKDDEVNILDQQNQNRAPHTPTMTDIKNKLSSNEICSISEFNKRMDEVLTAANSEELTEIYRSILKTVFPWYDPEQFGKEDEPNTSVFEESLIDNLKSASNTQNLQNEKLNFKVNFELEKFDTRTCALCKGMGDGLSHQEARLLYCGQNEWVHANCALWSSEVYEEIDGSLQNVHSALSRGRSIRCSYCKQKGASIGCCAKGCYETYHFSCARTVKCNFMHDKTVYCSTHELKSDSTVISSLADFDIRRSVYIELDKKKKKFVDPDKVHVIVGSLTITNLGKIVPILSDTPEAIIPAGFVCSRLFWSTVEPWKLIPYVITTSVLTTQINNVVIDKNFTVNHSLPKAVVDRKLKEILIWQKELEKEKIDTVELEDEDEPQNATEILSPELTNAILEELPHDLLDGISMQDIFPKFMSYEELLNIDFKSSDTQNSSDGLKNDSSTNSNVESFKKLSEVDEKELSDDSGSLKSRELKRSKSEVFPQIGTEKMSKTRSQQRSCSLTWSCKLDTSLSPMVKKRKIVSRDKNVFFQLLQVDGAYDSSSESECASPYRETENVWSPKISDEPVKCERCQCTYRTQASYKRHLESCEVISTSESDSETVQEQDFNTSEQSVQAVADAVATITEITNTDHKNVTINDVSEQYEATSFETFNEYQTAQEGTGTQLAVFAESVSTVNSEPNDANVFYHNGEQTATEQKPVQALFSATTQSFDQIAPLPQAQTVSINQTSNTAFYDTTQQLSISATQNIAISQPSTIPVNQITSMSLANQAAPICINQSNPGPFCLSQPTSLANPSATISIVPSSPITMNQQNSISLNQPSVISIGQQSVSLNSSPIAQQSVSLNNNSIGQQTISLNSNSISQPPISLNGNPIGQQSISLNSSSLGQQSISLNSGSIGQQSISLNGNSIGQQSISLNGGAIGQHPISIGSNQAPLQINQPVEIQSQQVTIQSVPLAQDVNQVLNITQQNPITIDAKVLATPSVTNTVGLAQGQWVKPVPKPTIIAHKPIRAKGRPRTLAAKRTKITTGNTIVLPQTSSSPQVIVQHIPSSNMVPAFLETFQQQTGQNLQYVATISPQITQTVAPQPQIVQLQSDNNIVSLVPGLQQPAMIIQHPRMLTDQLIIDQNGSVMWASQPVQPVYYGFETIVQNTVMQSQQFLPTTVPGILTANSSYSSTTQVFQTSKLEPILDVASGSFVLLNPGTMVNNNHPVHVAQIPQTPQHIATNVQNPQISIQPSREIKPNIKPVEIKSQLSPDTSQQIIASKPTTTTTHSTPSTTCNSINLPVAPFVSEQGIPTNIVTPTPKVPSSTQTRPMSRVLPMQTTSVRETKKPLFSVEKSKEPVKRNETASIAVEDNLKLQKSISIVEDVLIKSGKGKGKLANIETLKKTEELSLKQAFEKQNDDGLVKTNSENVSSKSSSVQVASLKPIKPKSISKQSPPSSAPAPTPSSNKNSINILSDITFLTEKSVCQNSTNTPNNKQSVTVKSEPKIPQEKIETNNTPGILYTVETQDGFRYSSTSISNLWLKVFEAVQAARIAHNMTPLPSSGFSMINNLQLLGLKANGLRYLLEQLSGASKCVKYKPNFNFTSTQNDLDDDILIGQSYGAIRCAPYSKRNESNDMFGWLASKHRKLQRHTVINEVLPRRSSITTLPMAMRFRQLRLSSKVSVGVYRSNIHRRGLFCLRDIESGEMVIEYAGEVIRSILTDKREKLYNSKGIGCYMFRIDDNLVVDATMKGNAARFINHSCDPNCYSKVVEILGHKHIIIFALRKIFCGEELTYDYKFPFEEDKIPCTCGARRCRKFLN